MNTNCVTFENIHKIGDIPIQPIKDLINQQKNGILIETYLYFRPLREPASVRYGFSDIEHYLNVTDFIYATRQELYDALFYLVLSGCKNICDDWGY